MSFGCVCASEKHRTCGEHGHITPAKRAAARYGHQVGPAKQAEQGALAEALYVCCGEPRELGHHPQCSKWTAPVEVHPAQEALL